jgi:hypothetical protein
MMMHELANRKKGKDKCQCDSIVVTVQLGTQVVYLKGFGCLTTDSVLRISAVILLIV